MERLDADFLYGLARDKSSTSRATLADVITDLFDQRNSEITDRERGLMISIMHGIIREVELSVRKNLGARLATRSDVPAELVVTLANDDIDVALPILTKSPVLCDQDLIEVIKLRTQEHQLAISLREEVSEAVSDELVATGNESVIESLLKNDNAQISKSTLDYLVEQSRRVDTFQEPLLHRSDLGEDLAKRMFQWVSEALRQHIVERYDVDAATVEKLLAEAASGQEDDQEEDATHRLAGTLHEEGMVTHDMLIAALSDGEVPLFLALFAELTGLKEFVASKLVFEETGKGLAIACRAVDIPEFHFAILFRMSRKTRPQIARHVEVDLPNVLDFYRHLKPDAAAKVLQGWKHGAGFMAAIESVTP